MQAYLPAQQVYAQQPGATQFQQPQQYPQQPGGAALTLPAQQLQVAGPPPGPRWTSVSRRCILVTMPDVLARAQTVCPAVEFALRWRWAWKGTATLLFPLLKMTCRGFSNSRSVISIRAANPAAQVVLGLTAIAAGGYGLQRLVLPWLKEYYDRWAAARQGGRGGAPGGGKGTAKALTAEEHGTATVLADAIKVRDCPAVCGVHLAMTLARCCFVSRQSRAFACSTATRQLDVLRTSCALTYEPLSVQSCTATGNPDTTPFHALIQSAATSCRRRQRR